MSPDPLGSIRTDAAGAIDEDVYCLICGYNLRGLAGDPVRCPECGNLNDLGTAAIPAEMIARAMRRMETSPTVCAGCAFAFIVFAMPFFFIAPMAYPCVIIIAGPSLFCWVPFYFRMKRIYENRPGWRGILRDFHIATFCCAAGVPLFWPTLILSDRRLNPTLGTWLIVAALLGALLFALGLWIYRRAQWRMGAMQRDTAVRMARDILRRQITLEMARRARNRASADSE